MNKKLKDEIRAILAEESTPKDESREVKVLSNKSGRNKNGEPYKQYKVTIPRRFAEELNLNEGERKAKCWLKKKPDGKKSIMVEIN